VAILKSILKGIGTLLLIGVLLLIFIAYAGQSEERYRCDGKIDINNEVTAKSVFLKMQLYRRWMFWSSSRGAAWTEIPNEQLEYYPKLSEASDLIWMSSFDSKQFGTFSTLSHALQLTTPAGSFTGMCKPIRADA
jgi:hypothetical protein